MSRNPKDGSHIQFYEKESVMQFARWLAKVDCTNPIALNGIKLPLGFIMRGGIRTMEYTVTYYDIPVGAVDLFDYRITYSK